ncbi:immune inhibitor A, partial [candidate division KSB1 bacterium]|nr:immune inhibitor A [candidate division KSB1 bacterium]
MKKVFIVVFLVVLTASLCADMNYKILRPQETPFCIKNASRGTETTYHEDFENDWNGWTTLDGTIPTSMWHLDDFNTPEGSGLSWWMGDPAIEGYTDHLYVVMDTPEITVPTNGHLTFDLNWYCETPGGEPAGYDGWDGCNVRISTDGGATWSVISGSPAYTNSSLYSFGFEHNEGTGIPGWCANSGGWVDADFDLSSYAEQDVMIRFAFASDPAYCTQDELEMFGMIVDNLSLGSFVHNFDDGDEQGCVASSMVAVGGDIWHIGEVSDAPSPTHAAIFQNDDGSFDPLMIDYIISSAITLPDDGEIVADFMVQGSFSDVDEFPEVDYWGWEVSPDGGTTWYAMSNPDGDPNGTNYVYADAPENWSSMIESYSLSGRLDGYGLYEGNGDVKFRIFFQSDNDDPLGTGIMIDDYKIYNTTYPGPSPDNLVAVADNVNFNVDLAWDNPPYGGEEGWIGWNNGEYESSLGLTDPAEWYVADRFNVTDIMPYIGGQITKVKFFPTEETTEFSVCVWTGSMASTLQSEVDVASPTIGEWNEIDLLTPVDIIEGEELWIGYKMNQTVGETYPAGMDAGPAQYGLWTNIDGMWQDLSGSFDNNWLIQGYVDNGEKVVKFQKSNNRSINGYNVYHSATSGEGYSLVDYVDGFMQEPTYTHTEPDDGAFNYYVVTCLWDGEESELSSEATVYVNSASAVELSYDDGSSESGFNVGIAKNMAVKFIPTYGVDPITLTHIKIYVHELNTGQPVIRIWDDDGTDGLPGTQLYQFVYSSANLETGWNTIEMPTPLEFTEGNFYAGIFEMAGLSSIGFDESGYGNSYTTASGNWALEESGNIMIRTIVEGAEGEEPEVIYGDVNGDENVSSYDAALTLQYSAGLISDWTEDQITAGD